MLKTAFVVAALAAGLSLGAVDRAAAMPSAMPTQLGRANADADTGVIQKAAGGSGGELGYGSDLVARSTALPAPVGAGVLLGDGAVRDGVGRLIAMAGA